MSNSIGGEDLLGSPQHPNPTALLTTLAVINVNWEQHQRSYLDNFVPFALEIMRSRPAVSWSDDEVRVGLGAKFGLVIPTRVVGSLLRRAAHRRLTSRDQNRFTLTPEGRTETATNFGTLQAQCRRQQRDLAAALVAMAKQRFNLDWTLEDAEEALAAHIERHAVPLLAAGTRGTTYEPVEGPMGREYVVSVFLADVVHSDAVRFGYLDQMVKGSMLASALYLDVHSDIDRKFTGTTLYLDTPVLLKSLGFEGVEPQRASSQVVAMAIAQGARIGCFEHTVRETLQVLDSAKAALGSSTYRGNDNGVLMHFRAIGATPSEVEVEMARLDGKITALGASVLPSPAHSNRLGVDEEALEALLQTRVGYFHRSSLLTDLDSLTAIHRARGGASRRQLERCRALLVTDNDRLVAAAREFFDRATHEWPVATLENDLAALMWVKEPQQFPDLPRAQVIADCMAALSPSQPLWSKVSDEIDRLQGRGEINEGDVAILRYSHDATQAIMDSTLGEPARVNPANIQKALALAKQQVQQPIVQERDVALARAAAAESTSATLAAEHAGMEVELGQVDEQSRAKDDRITDLLSRLQRAEADSADVRKSVCESAQRTARTARTVILVASSLLLIAGGLSLIPDIVPFLPRAVMLTARVAAVLAFATGIFGTVPEGAKKLETWVHDALERRRLSGLHVTAPLHGAPVPTADLGDPIESR